MTSVLLRGHTGGSLVGRNSAHRRLAELVDVPERFVLDPGGRSFNPALSWA